MKKLLLLVLLFVVGCGGSNPSNKLIGKWVVTFPKEMIEAQTKDVEGFGKAMAVGMMTAIKVDSEITAKEWKLAGMMGKEDATHKWSYVSGSGDTFKINLTDAVAIIEFTDENTFLLKRSDQEKLSVMKYTRKE